MPPSIQAAIRIPWQAYPHTPLAEDGTSVAHQSRVARAPQAGYCSHDTIQVVPEAGDSVAPAAALVGVAALLRHAMRRRTGE